jgi:hypothetical protein
LERAVIQLKTQTQEYWERDFTLTEKDIEQIYNHFLDVERPQTTTEIVDSVIAGQVLQEKSELQRKLRGRSIYQPMNSYAIDDELVFPDTEFLQGKVVAARPGFNPDEGAFTVITVQLDKKQRQFAAELQSDHVLNTMDADIQTFIAGIDSAETAEEFRHLVEPIVTEALIERDEFIKLSSYWFVKPLLADINIGHLHLAEAILDMSGGGPLTTANLLEPLELDPTIDALTQEFSLNYALIGDDRFDEVAPKGKVAWFLRRMEDDAVRSIPSHLKYETVDYDRLMFSSHLLLLERELADEWSNLPKSTFPDSITFSLIYPHRVSGTLPLNTTIRSMLPLGQSPRQIVVLRDVKTQQEFNVWVVEEGRYIHGLQALYEEAGVPIGGYVTISKTDTPGKLDIDLSRRRRATREDVRLASIEDNSMRFELKRRSIACDYDDLMVVGTDFQSAIDAFGRRVNSQKRSIGSLLAMIMPELADLTPQHAVHAKTIYSAINMLRRLPPGPIFAELMRYPAFQAVGDHYWTFDRRRWQKE